ncbi:MAG: hypothetical protein KJO98_12370 [Rhodothermia bacterium]|nr:hypothetical protein [Rhodothermia bacterium]
MKKPDARITAVSLVTIAVLLLVVSAIGGRGWNEESMRYLVRITARLSVFLFLIAYAWDDAHSIITSRPIRRPPPNREAYFVGFAASHLYHLFTLVALGIWFPSPFLDQLELLTIVGGGLAYAAIFGIAGAYMIRGDHHPDHRLITVGLFYVWIVFTQAYGFRVTAGYGYALIFALLIGAIVVKGIAYRTSRKSSDEDRAASM